MEQTFGEFIREKRMQRMMRLNAFAHTVGISSVYASYIENGKRPAPSEGILERISDVLSLSPEEEADMRCLAATSHTRFTVPEAVRKYLNDNPHACRVILIAIEKDLTKRQWEELGQLLLKME